MDLPTPRWIEIWLRRQRSPLTRSVYRRDISRLLRATAKTLAESGARREALSFLGLGAAFSQRTVFGAKAPRFSKGAVIRTVLKDISPDSVMGETLFHEHMSVAYSRTERQAKLPPPSAADIRPAATEIWAGGRPTN